MNLAGPYRCNDMLVKVKDYSVGTAVSVGTVTALDISLQYEGGAVEHVYGQDEGFISLGGKRATFTLQRWFMTAIDTDLLFDLFDGKLPFELTGEIDGLAGSTIGISNCVANTWRPIMGDANSIIGEEMSGEGTGWGPTNIT